MKCSLGIPNFLKRSLVFPILLFSSVSLHCSVRRLSCLSLFFFGTLHSDGCIFPFLLCLSLLLFSQLFVRPPDNHFALLHFFFLGMVLVTASCTCHEPPSIVLQARCLSDLIPGINLSLPLYSHKGFDLVDT